MTHAERKGRNGALELYRFVFCMLVLLFHCGFMGMQKGYLGVEFFFLTGGWFMMAHYEKQEAKGRVQPGEYLLGRVRQLYPYHLMMWAICFLWLVLVEHSPVGPLLTQQLSGLFLVNAFGIDAEVYLVSGAEWYLSAMLAASVILYGLLCFNKKLFLTLIAPVTALAVLGYMQNTLGTFNGTAWQQGPGGIATLGLWRAMAEMSLGCILYKLSIRVKARMCRTKLTAHLASAAELLLLALLFKIMLTWPEPMSDLLPLVLMMLFLFSVMTMESSLTSLLSHPVCRYLGRISMPMYLCQDFIRYRLLYRWIANGTLQGVWPQIAAIILFAVITLPICDLLTKKVTAALQKV